MDSIVLSVIITTYKRSDKLLRAINSVLNEKGAYELIIVDDNDEDSDYRRNNEKLMAPFLNYKNVKYIKHIKNMNGAAARNSGIKAARGEYITFLDNDDEFCNHRIAQILDGIKETHPDIIYTGYEIRANNQTHRIVTNQMVKTQDEMILDMLKLNAFYGTGSNFVCRRDLVDSINGFDTQFIRHQDYEFLIRYLKVCKKIQYIPEVLVIKNDDDEMNVPNFQKYYDVKKRFLSKYRDIIDAQSKKDRDEIYRMNFYPLLDMAFYTQNSEYIKSIKVILKKYDIYDVIIVAKLYLKNILKQNKYLHKIVRMMKGTTKNLYNSILVRKCGQL